ncbi:hypothetical protein IW261DRAFT_1571087 [Armillaria novae-zelandiae]|uniref:Uncharacterized protein n=1 Tax=Armillaria novae-zelandiae TaxID=153914 RepID=A0AA39NUT9_9AGAR|nr:hypothetical protein IW261DRAFT_1571087 [Armillaria novae-zelandiae]
MLDQSILIVALVSSTAIFGTTVIVLVYFRTQLRAWCIHTWPAPQPIQQPIPLQPIPFPHNPPYNVPYGPLPPPWVQPTSQIAEHPEIANLPTEDNPRSPYRRTNESESEGPITGPSRPWNPIRPRPGTPRIEEDIASQSLIDSSPETLLRQSPPPLSENPLMNLRLLQAENTTPKRLGLWAMNPDPRGRFPPDSSSESSSPDPEAIPIHQTLGAGPSQPIHGPTLGEYVEVERRCKSSGTSAYLSLESEDQSPPDRPGKPDDNTTSDREPSAELNPHYPTEWRRPWPTTSSTRPPSTQTGQTGSGRTSPTNSDASSENIKLRHGTSEEQTTSDEEERTWEQWNSTEELEAMRLPYHSDDGNEYMDLDLEGGYKMELSENGQKENKNSSSRNWASSRQPGRGSIATSPMMIGWEKKTYSRLSPFGGTTARNPFWPPRPLPDSPPPQTRTQGYYPWPTQGRLFAGADPGEGLSKKGKWNEGLDPMQEEEARIKREDAATERRQREAEIVELRAKLKTHNKFWDLDPPDKGKGPAEPAPPIPPRPHRGRQPPDPPPPDLPPSYEIMIDSWSQDDPQNICDLPMAIGQPAQATMPAVDRKLLA